MDAELRRVVENLKTEAELTAEELQYFQFSSLNDVLSILRTIQDKQAKTKRLTFLRRIDPFLKTMTEYGKVVEVFLNVSEFLAFIWVTSNLSDAFDSLLDTYQQIGEQIPLLESYKSLFSENSFMKSLLVMIYEDITSFHIMALRYFRQSMWKQFFRANWKGFSTQLSLLKDNLRRHKSLIESRASIIEFETIQQLRTSALENFRELRSAETSRKQAAVIKWLSPPAVEAIHERHINARVSDPQSCRWIFDDPSFQNWSDPLYCSTPLLWINGKPGAGKSVLASTIIEEVKKTNDVSVCFFYCGFDDLERNNFVSLARSLLSQLLVQNISLLLPFEEKMSVSGQVVLTSSELSKDLLNTSLRSQKTFIILDGIDECSRDQRKDICQWFKTVVDSLSRTEQDEIRCLFISQDDGVGRKDLSMLPTISLTSEHNLNDIERFSRRWQDTIEEKFGSLGDDGLDITQEIKSCSQGDFMFAKCVLEELYQQPTRADLLREWGSDSFPDDLNQIYDRILKRVLDCKGKVRNEVVKKLLSWISVAKRPLRWFEIQAAISIDLDKGTINEENRRLVESCKDLCASFVEVHEDQRVELVHSTVKEEIIETYKVELDLCLLSLAYLNYPEFDSCQNLEATKTALILGRYSFYEYAVVSWVPHLLSYLSEENKDNARVEELQETVGQFLDQHYVADEPILKVSKDIVKKLSPFKDFPFYDSLCQTVVWSRKQLTITGASDGEANVLDFPEITRTMRQVLEEDIGQTAAILEPFYGKKWFKCPKVYCRHFYDGFAFQDDREKHVGRHERAFLCTFEGCLIATIGCLSEQDLKKHMRINHGIQEEEEDFPAVSYPNLNPSCITNREPVLRCPMCPMNFRRLTNLRAHLKMHVDKRPFACTFCRKEFARNPDRKQHEQIHTGVRKVVCTGCGKSFSRQTALERHYMSKRGKKCLSEGEKTNLNQSLAQSSFTLPRSTKGSTDQRQFDGAVSGLHIDMMDTDANMMGGDC
ncbi:hypothetical protein IWW34DRAFT_636599 [Fusarium oxysporum f. sp. albedinis]|nr:hypothetical protein IWW34DRAFT_636599 [Fusarium oxysporum f. sp. albedinis]